MIARALSILLVTVIGCGAPPVEPRRPSPGGRGDVEEPQAERARVEPEASEPPDAVVSRDPSDGAEDRRPATERACGELTPADCRQAAPRCVQPFGAACREPADACETVTPEPSWSGRPVFTDGDPCERVRSDCAWSVRDQRCVPFARVSSCPPDRASAEAATVLCDHSAQPALSCRYRGALCSCRRSSPCGGAPPPPSMSPPPTPFVCLDDLDENGCPADTPREGASCRGNARCSYCMVLAECVGGRWRHRMMAPPP